MSIIKEYDDGWLISHNDYIENVYGGKHKLRPSIFNIKVPYKAENNKRKRTDFDPMVLDLENKFFKLLKSAKIDRLLNYTDSTNDLKERNDDALNVAKECTELTSPLQNMESTMGGNTSSDTVYCQINKCDLIIPKLCRFVCGDVRQTLSKIDDTDFDLIVVDPPWWNKYIRRKKNKNPLSGYQMMYNEEVQNLPIQTFLSDSAIVAVWCTNCINHENDIKLKMFPTWGVNYVATWFWLKVTNNGDLVCPLNKINGKQPFERLLLGVKSGCNKAIPDGKIFVSVPSALHSHKPPLNDLLRPYLRGEHPKCLEIFARYLLPNTTSLGLEPLRWQHISLYTNNTDV